MGWSMPMDISHRLRMPLLFVIAGAGMWFALQRRTGMQLFKERSVRLLVPLVIGMFVIVPPQVFYERLFHGRVAGRLRSVLPGANVAVPVPIRRVTSAGITCGSSCICMSTCRCCLPLMLWWRGREKQLPAGAWIAALALPLALNEALLKPLFPEAHNLVNDWYVFNHYLLFTVYGYLLASMPGSWQWLASQRHRFAIGGVIYTSVRRCCSSTVSFIATRRSMRSSPTSFTWFCVLAFLGYGYRHLSFCNPLLRYARDASYPIYILHQTVIVAIGYYVIQTSWAPWVKYWTVLVATLVSCCVLYELVVRRFGVTRLMFGMRPRAVAAPAALSAEGRSALV